jgi:exodeoxyribonuclease VII small subunit
MTDRREKTTERPVAKMSFEEALAELEQVVSQLEGGQVPLERSIELYNRGSDLKKHCEKKLGDAELQVQKIVAGAGGATGVTGFEEAPPAAAPRSRQAAPPAKDEDDIPF